MNEQVLAEIYANAIAQGVNPLMSSDNPFSDEWKRQVGYYGHNPIIDDRTPLATADYRPDFRFLDQWWRKYKPPVLEEEELEEEKPVEKVLEEIISEGGNGGIANDSFTDMRDPAFMGRESYPGMKDGQWLGGNIGWKDVAQVLGNMRGGIGGLLSGMLNGSLSTYGSSSGKNAIGNIADALGVNKDMALAEIGKALGYSDPATAAAKKDTGILGQLSNALFGGKPGTPNVKGMMGGTLAGYPNTWDNPTFSNIVNERATIAGVLNALANPDVSFGSWTKDWSAPYNISELANALAGAGKPIGTMSELDKMRTSLAAATLSSMPTVNGLLKGIFELVGDNGNKIGDIAKGRPMSSWEASVLSGLSGTTAKDVAAAMQDKTIEQVMAETKWGAMKDQSLQSLVDRLERQKAYERGEIPGFNAERSRSEGEGRNRDNYGGPEASKSEQERTDRSDQQQKDHEAEVAEQEGKW